MADKRKVCPWAPPDNFLVFEQRWKTKIVATLDKHGDTDSATNTIRISEDECAESIAEVWFHELAHAVWDYTALRELFTDDQQEKIIASLMPGLYATLKRNGIAFQDVEIQPEEGTDPKPKRRVRHGQSQE